MAYQVARAYGILPPDIRDTLVRYRRALMKGAVYPDTTIKDFGNHYTLVEDGRIHREDPLLNVVRRATHIKMRNLTGKELAFEMGIISHYIADLGQPLHTASTAGEKKIHSEMENDVKKHLWIMPFNFEDLQIGNIYMAMEMYSIQAKYHYHDILTAYIRGNGLGACLKVVQEAYNDSCNMIANIWRYLVEAGQKPNSLKSKEVKDDD
jgi:hypothetical protein